MLAPLPWLTGAALPGRGPVVPRLRCWMMDSTETKEPFSDGLATLKLSLLPACLCDLKFFHIQNQFLGASVMSQGRQSLGHHITAALGKHFQLHSKKKDHSVCVNIPTAWQCLNTGCSAIPGLETILVPKDSEKDQRYMSLLKIPRTLVLTLKKNKF